MFVNFVRECERENVLKFVLSTKYKKKRSDDIRLNPTGGWTCASES